MLFGEAPSVTGAGLAMSSMLSKQVAKLPRRIASGYKRSLLVKGAHKISDKLSRSDYRILRGIGKTGKGIGKAGEGIGKASSKMISSLGSFNSMDKIYKDINIIGKGGLLHKTARGIKNTCIAVWIYRYLWHRRRVSDDI